MVKKVLPYLLGLGFLVLLNLGSTRVYERFDLTKEKRFTLSNSSLDIAEKLDDVIYISVFLEGELPTEYKRLQNEIRNMLNAFRRASNNNIEFRFEDVQEGKTLKEKDDVLRQLAVKGLDIVRAEVSSDKETADKFLIPGAMAVYNEKEYPMNFLKREFGKSLDQEINSSIELLEYEVGDLIRKCIEKRQGVIGFTAGHGELSEEETGDITRELANNFRVESINLNLLDTAILKPFQQQLLANPDKQGEILMNGIMSHMNKYDLLVVAKPTVSFLDEELLLLDQYVMNGGKVIWLIDELIAEIDSVSKYTTIMTASRELRLNDLLFKYGVRINPSLVQDMNSHVIQVISTNGGNKPGLLPWYYYPQLKTNNNHPISKDIGTVWGRFVNPIDTLPNKEIKKNILLFTGDYSRKDPNPARVSLMALGLKPKPEMFPLKNVPTAVLLEGKFNSLFAKRRAFKGKLPIEFKESVNNNSMIVISDGDLIRNQINKKTGEIYPLGYDRFASRILGTPVKFSNKQFILNCMEYLTSEYDLIDVRAKKLEMRLLNKTKVETEREKWVWLNMLGPLVFLVLFGVVNQFIRRRKYTS
jgi:ABC-2 type transport system permease protein